MNKALLLAICLLLIAVFPTEQRNSMGNQKRSGDDDIAKRQQERQAWKRAHAPELRSIEPTQQKREDVVQPALRKVVEPEPAKRDILEPSVKRDVPGPAKRDEQSGPAKRNEQPEPAKRNEQPEPAKRNEQPEPAKRNEQPEPAKRNEQPEPAKRNEQPEPAKRDEDPKRRDFDFLYGKSEDEIVADIVEEILDMADDCDSDTMCTNEELSDDLDVMLDEAEAKYGSAIVDKALEAANDPNYKPPADKTEEVDALLDKLGNAATTNSNVYEALELVLDVYNDFAKKSYDLDVQIAQANEDISVNKALIDSRNQQNDELNEEIAELRDEWRNMGCDEL